ncbi:MAG: helix-turn-helix transcriptional regulator [Proteobacteria bacterium]|nr:helix-turn-helix transcriptional regulator [Pseudomonadota bacterium]
MDEQKKRYSKRIAHLLRGARSRAGLSSRELAKRVGSSHSTILAYEAGRKVPVTTTLMGLLHACGFSIDFSLSPRMRGEESYPKGIELEEALNLAGEFPAKFSAKPDSADISRPR